MSKLRDQQVKDFRYGRYNEVQKVLEFCAENPTWPKLTDKRTDEEMIMAAGMRTRRFVFEKDGDGDVDLIKDIFKHVWMPLARYEPSYLMANVVPEFESEPFQEHQELSDDINRVLYTIRNPPPKNPGQQGGARGGRGGMRGRPGSGRGGGQNPQGNGGGYEEGFQDPRGFNPEEQKYYEEEQQYQQEMQQQQQQQQPQSNWHEEYETMDMEEVDPYKHQHEICRCKKCSNLKGPLRCKICGKNLSADEIKKVEENEAKLESQKQKQQEMKVQAEERRLAIEEKARAAKQEQKQVRIQDQEAAENYNKNQQKAENYNKNQQEPPPPEAALKIRAKSAEWKNGYR